MPATRALRFALLCLAIGLGGRMAYSEEAAPEEAPLAPSAWLLLGGVDAGGRAPFTYQRTFERYLLDPAAPPPVEGEQVQGTSGRTAAWTIATPDEKGAVAGRGAAWGYATVEIEDAGVWLLEIHRASVCYVNGAPVAGDVYGHGIVRVPVALEAGINHLFAAGFRGDFRIRLHRPDAPLLLADVDATLPDLRRGATRHGPAGVLLLNCSSQTWAGGEARTELTVDGETVRSEAQDVPSVPPLGQLKIAVDVPGLPVPATARDARLRVVLSCADASEVTRDYALDLRDPGEAHRRTFRSGIDGSVQFYGVRPPPDGARREGQGLVLSLHGAGVDALGQAKAYSARPDFWVVAATNRRPFGFDWQDWGRQDAYEVLAHALSWTGVDRRHVHLTGHSMGGHGTWHLGSNDTDGFASLAPSAGWISFDTYGGRPTGPLTGLWHAADRSSLTLERTDGLRQVPTYVLHGTADDNVPASEARAIVRALGERAGGGAADLTVHYEKDAGHWWDGDAAPGADCVDWEPFFEMFRRVRIPLDPVEVDFQTADVGVDASHHWVRIDQPLQYGGPSRLRAAYDAASRRIVVRPENVRRFVLDLPARWAADAVVIDGREVALSAPPAPGGEPPARTRAAFLFAASGWQRAKERVPAAEKRPERGGPFKRVFDRGFVLVHGTAGTDAEDAALLARARYDAGRWRYRGNGRAVCLADTAFLADAARYADRNVVLYGNADTNAAWAATIPPTCPIEIRRGRLRAGVRTWEGDDLAAVFAYPRAGTGNALVGVVAGTGEAGLRLTIPSRMFLSGVGYPDFVLFGREVLARGDEGVRAAGLFDRRWQLAD